MRNYKIADKMDRKKDDSNKESSSYSSCFVFVAVGIKHIETFTCYPLLSNKLK